MAVTERSSVSVEVGAAPVSDRPWWRDWQLALLVAFVVAAYFTRLSTLSIRGEESRRGLIAREMIETGDWIIPRTQGVPLFSRPPLQNWMIAALALGRGEVDAVALRLPSVCAILLTCVLIYWYARRFLSPLGSLASGLAFASMAQVLELGRSGETDALFTLFVSGALLGWHGLLSRRSGSVAAAGEGRTLYVAWCLGYALAALGTLTKGPQAPVYFVGPVAVYLLCTRNWRVAFCRAHLAGIIAFILVLGIWQIPCLFTVGVEGVKKMYFSDVGHRFIDANWFSFGAHLAGYPAELLACLLPWSALLIVWFNRPFRRSLGSARDTVVFLAICLAVAFPSVWLPPGSRPRYFMSLYPCLALLIGLAVERVSRAQRSEPWWIVWPLFVRITAAVMAAAGVAVLAISVVDVGLWLAQPVGFAAVFALLAVGLAAAAWKSVGSSARNAPLVAVLSIAGFVGFAHTTVMINALYNDSVDTEGAIAALKDQLPPGTKLVSFNVTHHLFVFHYQQEVPVVSWPIDDSEQAARVPYFCADVREFETKELPFPWKPVVEISCDRHKRPDPRIRVVIGRRQDVPEGPPSESPSSTAGSVLAN